MTQNREVRYRVTAETNSFTSALKRGTQEFKDFSKGITTGLNEAQSQWQKFESSISKGIGIGAGFAVAEKAADALAGAIKAIPAAVMNLAATGSQISDLAAKTGLSTKAIQEFGYAAKLTGTSTEAMTTAVKMMQKGLVEGDKAFKALGLSTKVLKQMAPEAAFTNVAQAIREIRNPTEQAAAAMAVFGKSGTDVLPAVKAGIGDLSEEARRLGIVLGDDTVAAADRLDDETTRLSFAWEGLKNQFAAAIIESGATQAAIEGILQTLRDLGGWLSQNKTQITDFWKGFTDASKVTLGVLGAIRETLTGTVSLIKDLLNDMKRLPQLPGWLMSRVGLMATPYGGAAGGYVPSGGAAAPPPPPGALPPTGGRRYIDPGLTADAEREAERVRAAWQRSAEQARKEWDKFYFDLKLKTANMATDIERLLSQRALSRAGASGRAAFEQMQRQLSASMGGSGRLLSEETTNVTGFWSRDPEIRAELKESGGHLFKVNEGLTSGTKLAKGFARAINVAADMIQLMGVAADSTAGKVASVFGGVAGGAAAGAALGGPWGAVIGGAIGGIASIFGLGASEKKRREEAARELEEERRRIRESAIQMRAAGVEGVITHGAAFFGSKTILTEADAKRQGTLFAAAWGTVVREKGIVAAAEAFGDAFAKMGRDMEAAGLKPPKWFTDIQNQFLMGPGTTRLVKKIPVVDEAGNPVLDETTGRQKVKKVFETDTGIDESFKAIAQAAFEAAQFLKALADSGGLTEEAFRAFEEEARSAFDSAKGRAIELGRGEEDAIKTGFAAANPLLKGLLNESILSGQTLSADIQEMIDAQGIVPSVEYQQLDELRRIREAVGGLAPTWGGTGSPPTPGVLPPTGPHPKDKVQPEDIPRDKHMSRGGRIEDDRGGRGVPVVLHANETVVPDEDAGDFARSVLGHSANVGSVATALSVLAAEVRRDREERPRTIVQPAIQVDAGRARQADREIVSEEIERQFAPGGLIFRRIDRLIRNRVK